MDFVAVLNKLIPFFQERKIRHAVIGGVGLGGYGMSRATVDLDFVVDAGAQPEVIGFLESLGYRTLHRSTGYSRIWPTCGFLLSLPGVDREEVRAQFEEHGLRERYRELEST